MKMMTRLREIRKSKNMTQLQVQMQTGIDQSLLSKFELGERVPPTESLIALADLYNVSIDYILFRIDKPNMI
jgi:transcriptional regulator with XRE-family HTH domain